MVSGMYVTYNGLHQRFQNISLLRFCTFINFEGARSALNEYHWTEASVSLPSGTMIELESRVAVFRGFLIEEGAAEIARLRARILCCTRAANLQAWFHKLHGVKNLPVLCILRFMGWLRYCFPALSGVKLHAPCSTAC